MTQFLLPSAPRGPARIEDVDVARVASQIPAPVHHVVACLQTAGHQAVVVGGAVRDLLLGLVPGDFDVASGATPSQVKALFPHVVPTGEAHGTVTVMVDAPDGPVPVEVTTFRTEEGYADGRRPDRVRFVADVTADLARRDFTINAVALALAPAPVLLDPFDGVADLHRGVLRTVGSASARFGEDGLRALRAARMAAQLELQAAPGLEDAMKDARHVIAKVAPERVQQELHKLLERAARPSVGLSMMARTGLCALVPAAPVTGPGVTRPDRVPRGATVARWAAWLWEAGGPKAATTLLALRSSRALAADLRALCNLPLPAAAHTLDDAALRRLVRAVDPQRWEHAALMWVAEDGAAMVARVETLMAQGFVASPAQLALDGHALMDATGVTGARLGQLLAALMDHADRHPTENTASALRAVALQWASRG